MQRGAGLERLGLGLFFVLLSRLTAPRTAENEKPVCTDVLELSHVEGLFFFLLRFGGFPNSHKLNLHTPPPHRRQLEQDPKRLVLVSGSEDTTVRVWSLSEQCCTAVLRAHLSYVTSLAFLPGGAGLISGGRDRVLNVWGLDRCVYGAAIVNTAQRWPHWACRVVLFRPWLSVHMIMSWRDPCFIELSVLKIPPLDHFLQPISAAVLEYSVGGRRG